MDTQIPEFKSLPKMLAVLAVGGGSPAYIDKLSHAPSKDLALFYIEEALRDMTTLAKTPRDAWKSDKAYEEMKYISWKELENELDSLRNVKEGRELREILSFITAKALARYAKLTLHSGAPSSSEGSFVGGSNE